MAVVNEEQATVIRQICENYLSGMSMTQAALTAGIPMKHSGVKRLMLNPRYLGDEFYLAILTVETHQAVEVERQRRDALYKGRRYTREEVTVEVLGLSLFECYDMTEKLYKEVKKIATEINNFLNEGNSDERKQI